MTNYISLHNQTQYSILDSLISVKELFQKAKELQYPAIAITDHGSMASMWEALQESKKTGVKLIAGCELYFKDDVKLEGKFRHIVLLARNAIGYKNLLTIVKKGFDNNDFTGKRSYSIIDWKLLEEHSEGLICLTACGNGIISSILMNSKMQEAEESLLRLKSIFGEYLGLEIQPNNMKRNANNYSDAIDQQFINHQLINFGKKHNIRVVAACNAHYANKEDNSVHDVLLAIGSRQSIYSNFRLKYPAPEFYLKSGDEVKKFFSRNYGEKAAQEFCDNSIYFSDLCEFPDWIDLKYSNPSGKELPIFPVKDEPNYNEFLCWKNLQSEDLQKLNEDKLYLRYKCNLHFSERIKETDLEKLKNYHERVEEELDVLEYHGFSSYMLIVADFLNFARSKGISLGPGRGSGAGSLVGYLLNIHQADPIKYGLIFARFHNKEKKSFPDLDCDISSHGRATVQEYLKTKYGFENVAHVSALGKLTPKVYVRDIARACELGGSKESAIKIGNEVADCIPADIKSFNEAFTKIPLFTEYCKVYPEFVKYKAICGIYRNVSSHAAGAVVSARKLTGLIPLRKDKDGVVCLEYDKDKAEETGLVKMDLLGLGTLDIIEETLNLIKEQNKKLNVFDDYDSNDQKTYELISSGKTFGVFQFGTSAATIDICKKYKPKNLDDLSIITTLARPPSAPIRADYIASKEGKKVAKLLHPSLKRAFEKTLGYGLFDESILQLGRDVAGWDYNRADKIRKMIKEKGKNPEKDRKLKEEFIQSTIENGIAPEMAKRIWDEEVSKFGGYTFNASHATTYSMISYQTAYLKAHYPLEFLLANLMAEVKSNAPTAKANIEIIKKEIRELGVKILPPDLNKSNIHYSIIDDKTLLTGLDALKFVSDDAITDIISKRPFKNFADFMARVDSKKVRSNTIQALTSAGCLDIFGISRKSIYLYCSDYRKKLQIWLKKHDSNVEEFVYPWVEEPNWNIAELFALEKHYLNEGFICKPAEVYGNFFKLKHWTINLLKKSTNKTKVECFKGILRDFFEFRVKKETSKYYGQPMAKLTFEDKNGEVISCTVFPDRWQKFQERMQMINKKAVMENGLAFSLAGSVNVYEGEVGFIVDELLDLKLPPVIPSDLKAKKVSLRKPKEENMQISLEEEIEDQLYDQGLIDLDEELN
jgi:DNA polymerase III subunit alpha